MFSGWKADAVAVMRRSADILMMYLWRRGVFAVQYADMSADAIEAALAVRREKGYSGGMPPGAKLDAAEAVKRFEAGEMPTHGAYGLTLAHKHIPEMVRYAGLDRAPIFMPSVGNFYAGMLVHLPLHAASLNRAVKAADIHDVYAAQFGDSPFIRMGAPQAGDPEVAAMMLDASALAGCDHMEIFVFANADESQFWLTARLDNLGKGASGAAVQNMNIALGLDETAGLSV